MNYPIHEAAETFPLMDDGRLAELKADIQAHGLREAITLCDGKILDGRNRARACQELGIEPATQIYEGNPWEYVWSLNGQRRDIAQEVRAHIWVFVAGQSDKWVAEQDRIHAEANAKRSRAAKAQPRTADGRRLAEGQVLQQSVAVPVDELHKGQYAKAVAAGVNAGAIARAEALANNRPDLAAKIRAGELKPAEAQRQAKRDEVGAKVRELPKGVYTVIYADPPWSYNDKLSGDLDQSYGAADKHYPSMALSELKALNIPNLVAADSVLFLWATSPLLPDGLALCQAWGFTYKASFVWDKVMHNMGHYNSVRHEFLLVATRGSCLPQVGKLFDSVQTIERSKKHSEKPEQFREIIETLYPQGSKLELFARTKKDGWEAWGNEA